MSSARVRQKLQASLKQQSQGLLGLANLFKEYDTDGSGALSWEEFSSALVKCGLAPNPQDVRTLFLDLDRDGNNEISYNEFILIMRGDLSAKRKTLIITIFNMIDADKDGTISMTDIGRCFNPKNHPDVKSGMTTVNALIKNFFDSFSLVSDTGLVSMDQFIEYYANIAAFEDDTKFTETMKAIWNLPSNKSGLLENNSSSIGTLLASTNPGVAKNMDQLREQLISRGARGIVGLQRKFRIMDDDNSKSLNLVEFKKAMKECSLSLTDLQLNEMFSFFDKDGSGTIDFDEFLIGIRGTLNGKRKSLVSMAFNTLDKNGSGEVDPEDMVGVYNAEKHPDVIAGKRSADEVLREFLDTFDVGGVKDGVVTRPEFENYYANLSASIDDDNYFELMIRNAWHISGGEGAAANSSNRRVLVTRADGSQYVEEIKNDLGLRANDKAGMMNRLKAQGVNAANISLFDGSDNLDKVKSKSKAVLNKLSSSQPSQSRGGGGISNLADVAARVSGSVADPMDAKIAAAGPNAVSFGSISESKATAIAKNVGPIANPGLSLIIQRLKKELKTRGGNGFIALQRKFRILDDDNSKSLNLAEFKKGMKEMNLNLNDTELRMLFEHFDTDNSKSIDFEEFIQGVRDPLNDKRLRLVQMAFARIDKDGSGEVDAEEIAQTYDPSKHPEVLSGRKTAKQILSEFLDTFDVGGVKDGVVTRQEFVNYYTNLGANIDNEDYFELMIRNAWHISGGEGAAANSSNRRVLVTRADGSQYVEEIKNDLGLKADDKAGMMNRLKAQGVNAANISLFDGGDDNNNKAGFGPRPKSLADAATSKPPPSQKQSNNVTFAPPAPPKEVVIAQMGPRLKNPPVSAQSTVSNFVPESKTPPGIQLIIKKVKSEMKARGASGFIGMQRKFRIMDDDNSKSLSLAEFKKGMKEMNIDLSDSELRMVFDFFDSDHSGSINFEEFIQGVRDPLTDRRLNLVKLAFTKIDKDGSGVVEAAEIASTYDASKHPDVLAGKRTPQQVLTEFLDTFDVGGVHDGMVTQQEFVNYYTNLGANIDNEDYFELMIRNAWHISGGEGAAANSSNRRVLVTRADGSQYVEEIKNDLGLKADDKAGMMNRLKAQGVNAANISLFDGGDDNNNKAGFGTPGRGSRKYTNHLRSNLPVGLLPGKMSSESSPKSKRPSANVSSSAPVGVKVLIEKFKYELSNRGTPGFIALQRKFRIMDDDNSKTLSLAEFKKGLKEMNISLSDPEFRTLFDFFDSDHSGSIDFEEFIQGVRDPLTERRLNLVKLAFTKIDKDGSGIVEAAEIASTYDASKHPDVLAGRKTPQQVLTEFLDTFDVGGVKDGMVTQQEFINYYTNLGANIDNEDYFELMIRNAWHISGGEGAAANSSNRRVLVTRADGSQYVEEIKNDLGLKADDKAGMMNRLKAQGVNAANISLFDGGDDNNNKAGFGTPKSGALSQIAKGVGNKSVAAPPAAGRRKPVESVDSIMKSNQVTTSSVRATVPQPSQGILVIINRMKSEMKTRGGNGFIALQRKFKIMDDDNSKSLTLSEFKKAMNEMNLSLSDPELRMLFDHFDSDHSGSIDFEEFIQGVRDPLTERRLNLVKLAFAKIDTDGSGIVEAAEVASKYDASKHPDVISGKKTPQQVLTEFLDTFDVGGVHDGMVTQQEFVNYYTNLGANIDNEDYFELMIRNAWHISGGEGAAANSSNRRVLVTRADGSQYVEEIKNDLGLKADDRPGMIARLKAQNVNASQISLFGGGDDGIQDNYRPGTAPNPAIGYRKKFVEPVVKDIGKNIIVTDYGGKRPSTAPNANVKSNNLNSSSLSSSLSSINYKPSYGNNRLDKILSDLKDQLAQRGAKGIIGLQRKFRIIDDDNSKSLSVSEFKKAMKECALTLSDEELQLLFAYFDSDKNGTIDFEEFLQGVKGPLSARRRNLINLAFDVIDKDGSGIVEPGDLIDRYDASKHPDVISRKKTADEVMKEFLDTFDVGGVHDGMVTRDEFVNYYSNIGASIDNEDYFELMIRNAWHISGGEGAAANSSNRRVLVTRADGSQYVEEIKNDLGLKADDKAGMMNRLKAQGVNAANISLFDGGDDNNNKAGFGTRPKHETNPVLGGSQNAQQNNKGRKNYTNQSQFQLF
eukprot:gene4385-6201_t